MFRHPNYYKELRKRNKEEARAQLKVPSSNLDQVISRRDSTEAGRRSPGPGLKQQAIEETVPHNDIEEAQATSSKPQASSSKRLKPQATSIKPQA